MASRKSPPRAPARAAVTAARRQAEAGPTQAEVPGRAALTSKPAPPIVGIGASAGGLEAFEQFFQAMPADSGMGFVLVQHLDPSHASILTEILQRSTAMPVVEAQDQMVVEADRVHVIPPNRDLVIFHGALQLSVPTEPRGLRMPIDAFLRSLAEDQGERAIGIILSGTGTDGTLGLRAVGGAGGLCLVQDPGSAKYDGMPRSAIGAGYAAQVLVPCEMPQALQRALRALSPARVGAGLAVNAGGGLNKIMMLLRSGLGHDFSQYKSSTIGRRIERRMAQHGIDDVAVYLRFLREHPAELQTLFRELLINVTSFFRDPLAFAVLKDDILPKLMAGRPEAQALRIWVAGCSTGEEAYSIAILLREWMNETGSNPKVQLYSTDLDDDAIAAARTGLYTPNIAQDVSPERLRRFFTKEDSGYRVRKEVRDMVVFATQSVIKDPPFSRLDLLACRNLMIYLEPELQNRVIPIFHHALKPGGVLFLSPSESIGDHTELFEPIDRKWKFYRARATLTPRPPLPAGDLAWTGSEAAHATPAHGARARDSQLAELARRSLLQTFAPAAVLTDLQGNILYVYGDTGKYLRPAQGRPTHDVVEMARDGMQLELREALRAAQDGQQLSWSHDTTVMTNGVAQAVRLNLRRLTEREAGSGMLLISFQDIASAAAVPAPRRRPRSGSAGEARHIDELQRELALAKAGMKGVLEEQQASNEELKSANEELQSSNEELQSTIEELETSKEELQSVNEELTTVNVELQVKIEQMAHMQDDMKNLLDNIRVGTIFLDRKLAIRRFTREATKVYRLLPADLGRPLADIRSELSEGDQLLADAQDVLDSLTSVEREVRTPGGTWYLARIQPYRTMDNQIDGVVLTFADVTERVQAIATRKALALAEGIVDTVHGPLVVLDAGLKVSVANRAYFTTFGGTAETALGQPFFALGNGQWDCPALRELLDTVLPRDGGFEPRLLDHCLPERGPKRLRFSARQVVGRGDASQPGNGKLVLLSIEELAAGPS